MVTTTVHLLLGGGFIYIPSYWALSIRRRPHSPRMEKMARLGFCAVSSLIDLDLGDEGLLFHSILSKIVVEITLRCTGCEEKKFVPVNDLCALLSQSKNMMIKDFRVYWRVTSDRKH